MNEHSSRGPDERTPSYSRRTTLRPPPPYTIPELAPGRPNRLDARNLMIPTRSFQGLSAAAPTSEITRGENLRAPTTLAPPSVEETPARQPSGPGILRSRASSPRPYLMRGPPRPPSQGGRLPPPSHGYGRHSQRSYGGRSEGGPSSRRYGSNLQNPLNSGFLPPPTHARILDVSGDLQPGPGATTAPRTTASNSNGTSLADTPRSRGSRGDAYPGLRVPSSANRHYPHPGPGSYSPSPCSLTIHLEEDGWSSEDERSSWDSEDDSGHSGNEGIGEIFLRRRRVLEFEPEYLYGRCPRCGGCH